MKLKARQLIPGWPRGRSTLTQRRIVSIWIKRGGRVGIDLSGNFTCEMWNYQDIVAWREEFYQNANYHQAQDQMLEAWRRMGGDGTIMTVRGGFLPTWAAEQQRLVNAMCDYYELLAT